MIDGSTRLLGLVGFPLGHSLSPFFQNYLLARAGLPFRYVPFEVADAARLGAAVRGLAAAGVAGVNVTVPYKVEAARLCDSLSPEARAVGAANTLVFRQGRIEGHNTDVAGFLRGLDAACGERAWDGRACLVLGSGGAARAVATALARLGALVTVAARSLDRAEALAAAVESETAGALHAAPWEERMGPAAEAELIVNATPVGQAPAEEATPLEAPLGPDKVVYDLVYNPLETRLLADAARAGSRPVDGLAMLIHQGLQSLELWLGTPIDPRVVPEVRRRCEEELERRARARAGSVAS